MINEGRIRIHIEVTYNGLMLGRDDEERLLGSARHYTELREEVRRGLRALHGHDVPFALVVGAMKSSRAGRMKSLAGEAPSARAAPEELTRLARIG